MKIDIITIFPGMFNGVLGESMLRIAGEKGLAEVELHDLRKWTYDRHRSVDDKPFGGGPGMVMKVEPIFEAIRELKSKAAKNVSTTVILMTPQGEKLRQSLAGSLAERGHIIIVCGRYEGFDERIREFVDMEISIGDYILTGGEIPAMALCDSVIRLLPGVLGAEGSLEEESFEGGFLEYPQYTRPAEYKEMKVPEVLLSGDHKKIADWKKEESIKRTRLRRPDLMGERVE